MATSPSQAVIDAVADAEGVDAIELTKPLHDVVEPDALDSIFQNGTGSMTFAYLDYQVTVDHDGRVEVSPDVER